MKSRTLSKSEIKQLNQELFQEYGIEPFEKKELVMLVEGAVSYLRVDGVPSFFYIDGLLTPTLKTLLKNNFLKKITVDMGAVKFVAEGADIMRPGIVEIEEGIHQNEIISIIDQKNKTPLAIGKAMFNAAEMKALTGGKCITSIHHVGDDIWKLE